MITPTMDKCYRAARSTNAALESHVGRIRRECNALRAAGDAVTREYDDLIRRRRKIDEAERDGAAGDVSADELLEINAGGGIVTCKRGTLTRLKGTRLERLFDGRCEDRLPRDGRGRIFLDVNADAFRAIVDYLDEIGLRNNDASEVEPPRADDEGAVFLRFLIVAFGMEEIVGETEGNFTGGPSSSRRSLFANAGRKMSIMAATAKTVRLPQTKGSGEVDAPDWHHLTFEDLPTNIGDALEDEKEALIAAEEDLAALKRLEEVDTGVMGYFIGSGANDIIALNVSGEVMMIRRSALTACPDSVLARAFCSDNGTSGGINIQPVSEWTHVDLTMWAEGIDGLSIDLSALLLKHGVTGVELLAMRREDLAYMGISHSGDLALLSRAIDDLRMADEAGVTRGGGENGSFMYLEESPYCFGRMLDQLRIRSLCNAMGLLPSVPRVHEAGKNRFQRLVHKYFPGNDAARILGDAGRFSNILSPSHVTQIERWLSEDNVVGELVLTYRATRDGWGAAAFHERCDNTGATVTVIRTGGRYHSYLFGGFADMPWTSGGSTEGMHVSSPKAFLFVLRCHAGVGPLKLRQKGGLGGRRGEAVRHDAEFGPTFGVDLVVGDDAGAPGGSNFCDIGKAYECPKGVNGGDFLTGNRRFRADEIEVFSLV